MTAGPATSSRTRALLARAVGRPPFAEPLDADRQRGFWAMTGVVSAIAFCIDVALVLGLRRDPHVDRGTLDAFAMIVLPVLAGVVLLARASEGKARGPLALGAGIVGVQISVILWIQATGSLSSYFLVAAAMLGAAHRALLSWTVGALSVATMCALHGGAFALEELAVLDRAPLFRAAPGPIYDAALLRWTVLLSIFSVYAMTWMGTNLLMWTLRSTERALASAERRLAAAAEGAREGRLTGREIGGYRLLEVIGRGGMAEVYRGARAGGDARAALAIKVVHPHLVDDSELLARVRREAEIASRLPASVTPAVRDVQLTGPGERFVVLDHLDGEDLAALLRRRGKLPPDEAIPLLAAACRAVDVVHAAGVVHRDVKPQNLFVLPDGGVRVLDFGVARADDRGASLTHHDVVLGTPGYIAPEMISGGAAVGPEADVFALGVVAYQALTGERPFPADAGGGGAVIARDTPPPSRLQPTLPVALDVVLALALSPAPTRRYQRASELALDLERALAGTLPDEVAARVRAHPGSLDDTVIARRGDG